MNSVKLLQDKVCIVTGSNKGIGQAIVEKFAAHGAIVFANARQENSLDDFAEKMSEKYNTTVIPIYFDVTDYEETKKAILEVKKKYKSLDVLVNNAGKVSYEVLGMVDLSVLRETFETNVVATVNLMQLATKLMMRQRSGSIINISSLVGDKGTKGQLGYSATKGAVIALTKSASKDLAKYNIRVNSIAPGMIETERFQKVMQESFQEKINDIGFQRLGKPSEVAGVTVFLASDLSTYVTGQVIGVDGSLKL